MEICLVVSHNSGAYATITCLCSFIYLNSDIFQKEFKTAKVSGGCGVRLPGSDPCSPTYLFSSIENISSLYLSFLSVKLVVFLKKLINLLFIYFGCSGS